MTRGRWGNTTYLKKPPKGKLFGEETTARLAGAFFDSEEIVSVQDWGCGWTGFRQFIAPRQIYYGIDESSPYADENADLATYQSTADAILLRHVLEHNRDWRTILRNAVASCVHRLCIVLFTPFSTETRVYRKEDRRGIPDMSFAKEDILRELEGFEVKEQLNLKTHTQYGVEHVLYAKRKPIEIHE